MTWLFGGPGKRKIRKSGRSGLWERQVRVVMKCEGLYVTCWHPQEYFKHRRLVLNNNQVHRMTSQCQPASIGVA